MPQRPRSQLVAPIALVSLCAIALVLGRLTPQAAEESSFNQRVVLQNDRVRAQLNAYPAGVSSPEHEHKVPRVVVVIEGGTLEIRDASGKISTLSLKNGDIVWRPPEKHTVTNSGSTPVRLIEIDVLDCPKK